MRSEKDLFSSVIKNSEHGYYELAEEYRRTMDDFYKNEYYQDNHALYQHVEYDTLDVSNKHNFYAQKLYVLKKWGGTRLINRTFLI